MHCSCCAAWRPLCAGCAVPAQAISSEPHSQLQRQGLPHWVPSRPARHVHICTLQHQPPTRRHDCLAACLQYIREKYWEYEYEEVVSPNMYNFDLWKTSGHAAHYKENMFCIDVEKQEFGLKPMNCPGEAQMSCSDQPD